MHTAFGVGLGVEHHFWSPVPPCGHILCEEPCVIVQWVCNPGESEVAYLWYNAQCVCQHTSEHYIEVFVCAHTRVSIT